MAEGLVVELELEDRTAGITRRLPATLYVRAPAVLQAFRVEDVPGKVALLDDVRPAHVDVVVRLDSSAVLLPGHKYELRVPELRL